MLAAVPDPLAPQGKDGLAASGVAPDVGTWVSSMSDMYEFPILTRCSFLSFARVGSNTKGAPRLHFPTVLW